MFSNIRCPKCAVIYKPEDTVILDEVYTIHHIGCYDGIFAQKEIDTFVGLVQTYECFRDLIDG